MATSSITHNFVLTDSDDIDRFVHALDLSAEEKKNRKPTPSISARLLTDPQEIAEFMTKVKWSD